MHDDHDHHHAEHDEATHHHPTAADDPLPPQDALLLERAVRTLLIRKGVLTAAMIQRQIENMDSRNPAVGAQVVAKAWLDDGFRRRLAEDPLAAIEQEIGIPMVIAGNPELKVLFNAPGIHNVVVCTLCSCYPRMLLGIPPAWYKAADYRARVVRQPRTVLEEFGLVLPADMELRVHDSTADLRYLVVPERPAGTEGWSEAQLQGIVTRDCMIGVAVPNVSGG